MVTQSSSLAICSVPLSRRTCFLILGSCIILSFDLQNPHLNIYFKMSLNVYQNLTLPNIVIRRVFFSSSLILISLESKILDISFFFCFLDYLAATYCCCLSSGVFLGLLDLFLFFFFLLFLSFYSRSSICSGDSSISSSSFGSLTFSTQQIYLINAELNNFSQKKPTKNMPIIRSVSLKPPTSPIS